MELLLQMSAVGLDYMLLLFLRVSGLALSSPIFGRQSIPNPAKICYALALTYFFFTTMTQYTPIEYAGVLEYALLCAKEMIVGLALGYVMTMFFDVVFTAGQLIDMQMGFGMANIFDEQSNASVPLMGNLLNVMMMLCFVAANGFERLLLMMKLTMEALPLGSITLNPDVAWVVAELFCTSFVLGVQMSVPVIASGMLGEVVMGMMVRTVPQMNVFVIGLPLRVLLGMVVFAALMPLYGNFSNVIFDHMFSGIEQVFAGLAA